MNGSSLSFFYSGCRPSFSTLVRTCTSLTKSEEKERLLDDYLETDSAERQISSGNKEASTTRYEVYPACNGAHLLAKCKIFIDKNFEERLKVRRKAQLCNNYFGGALSKRFETLRNVPKLLFLDEIGHAKSLGFRLYSAI